MNSSLRIAVAELSLLEKTTRILAATPACHRQGF